MHFSGRPLLLFREHEPPTQTEPTHVAWIDPEEMKMSKAAKVYLAVAAVIVAASVPAGLLTAGASTASTTACGSACTSPSVESLGTGEELAVSGSNVVMSAASTSNSAEDWTLMSESEVAVAVQAGVVSARLLMNYQYDTLVEFQYVPDGVPSDKCLADSTLGTAAAPTLTVGVAQCGITAQTLWIVDSSNYSSNGYVDLINAGYETAYSYPIPGEASDTGITNAFAEPYVLAVNSSSDVVLAPLSELGGVVSPSQMWTDYTSASQSALRAKLDKPR
jgi:hypothetical protein